MSKSPIYTFNKECLIRIVDLSIIISNPRLRIHVEVDDKTSQILLLNRSGLNQSNWEKKLDGCSGKNRTQRFIGSRGLVKDHSGLLDKNDDTPTINGKALFRLLRDHLILIENPSESLSHYTKLNNLLDQKHLGTFHERVGQYVLLGLKEQEPWRAWQRQKFSEDGKKIIGENYVHVQEPFFDKRYTNKNLSGSHILDFGCGNGYFSNKFAKAGACVIGIDSSKELLALAKKNYSTINKLEFNHVETIRDSINYLNSFNDDSLDLIYLQDTLLLLLNPENGLPSNMLNKLLKTFRRILNTNGALSAMEPNPIFWLSGRYGSPEAPYAIVTEYRHHIFNVAPNLDVLLPALADVGFGLVEYLHPSHTDPQHEDYNYVFEFPIWDFFHFKLINK